MHVNISFLVAVIAVLGGAECRRYGGSSRPRGGHGTNPRHDSSHSAGSGGDHGKSHEAPPSANIGAKGYPVQREPTQGSQGTNYGWRKPESSQNAPPAQPGYGWRKPETHQAPSHSTGSKGHPVQEAPRSPQGTNYGWRKPDTPHGYFTGLPAHRPAPPPHAQPAHYGFSPAYYPPQSNVGYPGQGLQGASYGGLSIFGAAGHHGYPPGGHWGTDTYASPGRHDMLKGLAVGLAGGYLLRALLQQSEGDSNPWGAPGHGYAPHYHFHTQQAAEPLAQGDTSRWIQCVAYDPVTQVTHINPNCSCTVTAFRDAETNLTTSLHNCTSPQGHVEQRRLPGGEVLDSDPGPVKLVTDGWEQEQRDFFQRLEKIVHMGRFVS